MENATFRLLYLLTDPFGIGGVQSDIKALGPHFVRKGHEVVVLSPPGDQVPFLEKAGVRHIPFSVHFRTRGEFRKQSSALRAKIDEIRPTVLAPQSIRSSWLCHAAARDLPIIRVTTIHNIHMPLNSLWAGALLNRCSHLVVFESDHEHKRMTRLGLSPAKARVVPSGIDTDHFNKNGKTSLLAEIFPDLTADTVIFGCVARLSEEKGHKDLLRAFSLVRCSYPNIRLVLVGDGPLRESLSKQVSDLGLSSHVHFSGQKSEIRAYMNLFDIFVLASTRESLPRAAREAMACGLPVIATTVGATREAIFHGSNGLLVPPRQPKRLTGAMLSLIRDPELRSAMGAKSLSLIRDRFSQQKWFDDNESIYLEANSHAGREFPKRVGYFLFPQRTET